jgi:formate-dependent nitrite reductase cytochrome c552 subunit
MHCHHARRAPEGQIDAGYGHFGPHGSPQADMAYGKSAFHAVADPGFQWADPSHLKVQNSCKTCHLNMVEYVSEDEPAITGHTFEPTTAACVNCHGEITAFTDIMALDDFDGDGSIEGLQHEVQGLMKLLETALIDSFAANGITTTGWDADSLGHEIGIVKHAKAPGDTLVVPNQWRAAGYNWIFVLDDKSSGVHNPDYAVQILQQSYKYLTGNEVPRASIVYDGKANSVAAIRVY